MASDRQRRHSMEDPPMLTINDLNSELNKLHEEGSAECQRRIKNMNELMDEIEEDYRKIMFRASIAGATGRALTIGGLALAFVTFGFSLILSGIGVAASAAAGVTARVGTYRKTLQEKKVKQTIETELEELKNKMSPMINLLEKMFQLTQEILTDPKTPKHKVTALRDCFDDCSQMCQTFNLTGKLSGTLAEMRQMLELLDEITEDKKDKSAKPTKEEDMKEKEEEIEKKEEEIKKASEKFINEMRKGIDELQNTLNEINQQKERISKSLNDNY